MPSLTVRNHGYSAGVPGVGGRPGKRGDVDGWSYQSARRNASFLQCTDALRLPQLGFSVTLTVGVLPADPAIWRSMREALFARCRRMGLVCGHWLTEWQRSGRPHLHCALFFDRSTESVPELCHGIKSAWLAVAGDLSGARGQHVVPIEGALGWLQYVAKHGSRSVRHYQRASSTVPDAWRGRSVGRMWGVLGDWPKIPEAKWEIPAELWFPWRRLMRRWHRADVRSRGGRARGAYSHGASAAERRRISAVMGVGGWTAPGVAVDALLFLAGCHDPGSGGLGG